MDDIAHSSPVKRLFQEQIVAVVRLDREADGVPVAEALFAGGVGIIEITITTPNATKLIQTIRARVPGALVGAGSIATCDDVDACLDAGAEFLVAPVLDPEVFAHALSRGAVFSPGTFTPSEAFAAWRQGAPLVKVFPAARLGPKFISDLKAPMPQLKLMPTGGITAETLPAFLAAGADAVGAGSWLTPKAAIRSGEFEVLTRRAKQLVAVKRAFHGGATG